LARLSPLKSANNTKSGHSRPDFAWIGTFSFEQLAKGQLRFNNFLEIQQNLNLSPLFLDFWPEIRQFCGIF
jgi:hypothetical protein